MTDPDLTPDTRASLAIDRARTSSSAPAAQVALLESIAHSLARIGDAVEGRRESVPVTLPVADLQPHIDAMMATAIEAASVTREAAPSITLDEHTALRELFALVGPYARVQWLRAAVSVADNGFPPRAIETLAGLFDSGALTEETIIDLAKAGIEVSGVGSLSTRTRHALARIDSRYISLLAETGDDA